MFKTKEEKAAYRKGMQAQFNKEHPVIRYEVVPKYTSYDEKGNISGSYTGLPILFGKKKEAMETVDRCNERERFSNERVMNSVKRKSVNVHNSAESTTAEWFLRKVDKPYRRKTRNK